MELIKRNGFYWQEDIIAACKAVHGDKYDYSQVEEKISNKDDKITIICHSKTHWAMSMESFSSHLQDI